MALVFLALFALVAGSVLTMAGTVEFQRGSTEKTAATDSVAEGSAQFALADTRSQPCGAVNSGTMTFPSTIRADTVSFGVTNCTASTSTNNASGTSCELCILDSGSPPQQTTPALSVGPNSKILTVNGELDSNGSIAGPGSVKATGPNGKIGLYKYGSVGGATCAACTPAPTALPNGFIDPLYGKLKLPTSSTTQTCCSGLINPGVYSGMNITNTVVMSSGVYVVTGGIAISGGQGLLTNSDASAPGTTDGDSGGLFDTNTGGASDSNFGPQVAYPPPAKNGDPGTLTDSSKVWGSNVWAKAVVTITLDSGSGATVSYASTSLTDTSKSSSWSNGKWKGALVLVTLSNGTQETATVTSSSPTKLTMSSAWASTPSAGSSYKIIETSTVAINGASTMTMSGPWGILPAAGSPYSVSLLGYTANTLVDTSKSWSTSWAGDVVTVALGGGVQETDTALSNTGNTLTMNSPWATLPPLGSKYTVSTIGYTNSTLVDTSKNWATNQWAGDVVTVTLTNGTQEPGVVASNSSNTMVMTSPWSTIPDARNGYVVSTIGYTANTVVDTDPTKSWGNNVWAGAVVTVTLSSGTASGYSSTTLTDMSVNWTPNQWAGDTVQVTPSGGTQETNTVSSNTATTLTLTSAWGTTPSAGDAYAITEAGTVASNGSHTLTLSAPWTTIPAAGSPYSVVAAVVIYLACPTSGPFWSCAPGGQAGGYVSTTGSGTLGVKAAATGLYAGIALFTDPNLTDPSGGQVVSVAGNGGTFGGTIYAPRGTMSISGGGTTGPAGSVNVAGRVIVENLFISGNSASVLAFTGPAPATGSSYCYSYTDSLSGSEPSSAPQAGDVTFESGCSSAGVNGQGTTTPSSIVNFDYGGP
jgi:hypothetical protein